MGKVDVYTIIFNDNKITYLPGEWVRGYVVLRVKERFKINSHSLELNGHASVHWTETKTETTNGKSRSVTRSYSSHQTIISLVWSFEGDTYLECGEKIYRFEFQLPIDCPPSYSHPTGSIIYELDGKIDRSWALNKKTAVQLLVLPHLDLNRFSHLRIGAGAEDLKHLCCGPCQSKPIKFQITTSKSKLFKYEHFWDVFFVVLIFFFGSFFFCFGTKIFFSTHIF
jgi:hypothetical protein